MDEKILQFPGSNKSNQEDIIDIGELELPQMIVEARNFVDLSKGAQLVALIGVENRQLLMLKGSAVFHVMTKEGPRGVQVEIDFPIEGKESSGDSEADLLEQITQAFNSYEELAEEAVREKQEEMKEANRLVGLDGSPLNKK